MPPYRSSVLWRSSHNKEVVTQVTTDTHYDTYPSREKFRLGLYVRIQAGKRVLTVKRATMPTWRKR